MKTKKQIEVLANKARLIGSVTAAQGGNCIPCNSADLMKLLEGIKVGEGVVLLNAFNSGVNEILDIECESIIQSE